MWKILSLAVLLSFQSHQALVSQTPTKFQGSYDLATKAIFAFSIRLQVFQELIETDKNFIISPLSSALMLGELMLGAEGQFRRELYNIFSLPDNDTHKLPSVIGYYDRYNKVHVDFNLPYAALHLELANLLRELQRTNGSHLFSLTSTRALFVNSDLLLKEGFVHNLKLYQTHIQQLNFAQNPIESQTVINNWASKQTKNVITTILDNPPSPSDAAIFANAVYFKADWKTPFSHELTYNGDFHINKNKTTRVEYMRGFIKQISYVESTKLGCKMIGLPYKNDEVVMYIFLPNESNGTEYNIKQFATKIITQGIVELVNQSRKYDVNIQLPKMKITSSFNLLKKMQEYIIYRGLGNQGIRGATPVERLAKITEHFHAFTTKDLPDLYLTNATKNERLKISKGVQKITLIVDEKGTETTNVSASLVNYSKGSKNFQINRPFFFYIRHEPTSTNLFWGNIINPVHKE